MKKIYSIFSFLLIFNVHIFLKNVKCNGIINYNGSHIRSGLPTNSLDIINDQININEKIDNSNINPNVKNSSQNISDRIHGIGQNILISGTDTSQTENSSTRTVNQDAHKSPSDSYNILLDDGSFGGGYSASEYNVLLDSLYICPADAFCKNIYNVSNCPLKKFDGKSGDWVSTNVKDFSTVNKGVLVPPRRRHMCFRINKLDFRKLKKTKGEFEKFIYSSAGSEAKKLIKLYDNNTEKALQALKYGFADIGNIIQGEDMMDTPTSDKTKTYLEEVLRQHHTNDNGPKDAKTWWVQNKHHVWDAMMCGYESVKKDKKCPYHNNFDQIPQFLRWFREWATYFCNIRKNEIEILKSVCYPKKHKVYKKLSEIDALKNSNCVKMLKNYEELINVGKAEWKQQYEKYNKHKNDIKNKLNAEHYMQNQCPECGCEEMNLKDIFDKDYNRDDLLKELRDLREKEEVSNVTTEQSVSTNTVSDRNVNQSQHETDQSTEDNRSSTTSVESSINGKNGIGNNTDQDHVISLPKDNETTKSRDAENREKDYDPYERVLGWEFGNVHVPGTNPYISSKESDSLELINLTSWDKEDIIKQNEDVKDEIEEQQQEKQEDEEGFESDLNEVAETNEEDQDEILEEDEEDEEDEEEEEEEEDEDEVEENIEEEKEKKDRENTESEKQEKEVKESEQHTEKGKEGKKGSTRDADEHQILSVNYKNNNDLRKGAETIVKKLFSLFNENNNLETMFKDLTKDMTSLFQQ
ncbi:duffy binding-like merozoite surface protein [Plasmodium sp. DRC-Itaito]|nr:duffy binding-like merozoite surface protein [Plasmodium sp. DRC-Itaito]